MVVMSIEQYENIQHDNEIFIKLKEAELEADSSKLRYSHAEVFNKLRMKISNKQEE
ncbi:hypothetical protein D1872_295860 [compost metagenome]